jgi:hypothetical protein
MAASMQELNRRGAHDLRTRRRRLLRPQERDVAVHRRVRYASRNQPPKRLALADLEITLNTVSCWFE